MSGLEGRLILLGVTGSIAAYKSAELVRALTGAGADVQTLLSRSASAFIGALTYGGAILGLFGKAWIVSFGRTPPAGGAIKPASVLPAPE